MRIGIDGRKLADFGIGTYIRGLLGGLAELGGGDEYVVFSPPRLRTMIPDGFEHVAIDAPHYSVRELLVVGRAIGRARLDVFHAPHYVVPLTRCPTVVTIHDLIHLHIRHANPLKPLYARAMLARAVRKSARVLTVSDAVRGEIVSTFGSHEGKVLVTPNAAGAAFTPDGRRREGRYFLFVGNDKPHKNAALLAEAFAIVRRTRPDLRLVFVGGRFATLAGRDSIELESFVPEDDLAALYRGAIALVMPSREEGFGLPLLEAMACGAPVIASRAEALVEVSGGAALHVDAAPSALAEAMLRVAGDEALRRDLASRGIARAASFTWRRCAEITREVYAAAAGT